MAPNVLEEIIDIIGTDDIQMNEDQEKNYYCQRCLNHGLKNPRKGHKPACQYTYCKCAECFMVERRRQLNSELSKNNKKMRDPTENRTGKRIRDPQCARCGAHGVKIPLRGHKRSMCQFKNCDCKLCSLVENRRSLMAAQIKLRRNQQKNRNGIITKTRTCKPRKDKDNRKKRGGSTSPSVSSTCSTTSTNDTPLSTPPPQQYKPTSIIHPIPVNPLFHMFHQHPTLFHQPPPFTPFNLPPFLSPFTPLYTPTLSEQQVNFVIQLLQNTSIPIASC